MYPLFNKKDPEQKLKDLMKKSDVLLSRGEFYKALCLLRDGFKIDGENLDLHYLFGIALQKLWRLNLAEKEFEFLRKKKSQDSEILRQLGWTKILKGELKEGRNLLREAINLNTLDPLSYADLGTSFIMGFDFDEGLKWLEAADSLSFNGPHKNFIRERLNGSKEFKKGADKFSEKEKSEMKKMRNSFEELKIEAVNSMFSAIVGEDLMEEDYEEIKEELKIYGLNPEFGEMKAPKTKEEKSIYEYMKFHSAVPDVERKISKQEFDEIKEKLFFKDVADDELKKILLILAHQGTKEAIEILEDYSKKSKKELRDFVKLAIEECSAHLKAGPDKMAKIIHRVK